MCTGSGGGVPRSPLHFAAGRLSPGPAPSGASEGARGIGAIDISGEGVKQEEEQEVGLGGEEQLRSSSGASTRVNTLLGVPAFSGGWALALRRLVWGCDAVVSVVCLC